MTKSTAWLAARIALWGAALAGVLRISRMSVAADHGICGPWGCGPPLSALIACHGFWIVLLLPPTVMLLRRGSARTVRAVGLVSTSVGIATLSVIAIWEWTHWYAIASDWQRGYLVHRYLFSIVTLVDVPVIEITLLGVAGLAVTARAHGPR
jgi:hypothetical protein